MCSGAAGPPSARAIASAAGCATASASEAACGAPGPSSSSSSSSSARLEGGGGRACGRARAVRWMLRKARYHELARRTPHLAARLLDLAFPGGARTMLAAAACLSVASKYEDVHALHLRYAVELARLDWGAAGVRAAAAAAERRALEAVGHRLASVRTLPDALEEGAGGRACLCCAPAARPDGRRCLEGYLCDAALLSAPLAARPADRVARAVRRVAAWARGGARGPGAAAASWGPGPRGRRRTEGARGNARRAELALLAALKRAQRGRLAFPGRTPGVVARARARAGRGRGVVVGMAASGPVPGALRRRPLHGRRAPTDTLSL